MEAEDRAEAEGLPSKNLKHGKFLEGRRTILPLECYIFSKFIDLGMSRYWELTEFPQMGLFGDETF